MVDFRNIISRWPSVADFAADIGVEENTAKQMRTRNRVNGRYWLSMIEGASTRGFALLLKELNEAAAAERLET